MLDRSAKLNDYAPPVVQPIIYMFQGIREFLARRRQNRLVKQGYACGKTRRRRTKSELLRSLETSWELRTVILLAFMAGLVGVIAIGGPEHIARKFLIGFLILATAVTQLAINIPETFYKNSRVFLVFGLMLLQLTVVKILMVYADNPDSEYGHYLLLLLPVAFAPLMLSVLLGKSHGFFAAVFTSLWGAIFYRSNDAIFLVMSLISGFIAVSVTLQVRRRTRLIRAGFYVGLATWLLALPFELIKWDPFGSNDWKMIGIQSLLAVGGGILTAMLVGGALPMVESLFHITTDITWLEMADLNHPLLKRMTIEAPGTYHHSLVVANLAEAAAESIGADATMCRVCSYFHDIGKLVKPEYFTENMNCGHNPHDELAPTMSALIIIAHVKEGVDLALKHKLNQKIVDVIQQHHGTSMVYFFYKRALQQQEDARHGGKIMNIREEDIPEVREQSFRYPGPRPQSKEAGIIMMADMVESASRSLNKPTPGKVEQMINDLIDKRIEDHQLDDCHLTLKEIRTIAESFRFTLQNMLHSRIAYPKDEDDEGSGNKSAKNAPVLPKFPSATPASAPPVSAA